MRPTILCLASYEKGADFLRECRALGCQTVLVTVDKLREADWPREAIDEFFHMADFDNRTHVVDGVSYLARTHRFDAIVPLDEFDLELAATLREHLRVPGLGETGVRFFRDKLAMRQRTAAAGVPVPRFTAVFNDEDVGRYLEAVAPPWVLKPRTEAAAIGIRKLAEPDAVAHWLDELGDRRSRFLLEEYVPGPVFHVDAVVVEHQVVFAAAHRYIAPPFDVAHEGGLFGSVTLEHGGPEETELHTAHEAVMAALGLERGVFHTEFIRAPDGRFRFLETAARVGGAHIADLVEVATGVNLWREWARLEVSRIRREKYTPPASRADYGGLLISLARQEWPDLATYDDPEIAWRLKKRHHAGLAVVSDDRARVAALLDRYVERFRTDFMASMPAPDRPSA
ncbi:MAG: ATPase [Gemmatimonadota bacterium]|jgi:biotin carboxylase